VGGMFQTDRTSVADEDRSGRLTTSGTANNVERVNALVQEDRRINVTHTADKLDISCGAAHSIIHEDPEYHKICRSRLPQQLNDKHKRVHVETCMRYV